MAKKNNFMKDLKKHKEGLIIGGLVGAVAAYNLVQGGYDLTALYESGRSLADSLMGRNADLAQTAITKLYAVTISLGATLGYMADKLIGKHLMKKKMNGLRARKRKR